MIRLTLILVVMVAGGCPSSPGPTPPAPDYTGSWTDQPEWDWSAIFPDQPIPQVEPRQIPARPQPGEITASINPNNDLQTILNSGITWFELQPGDYTEQDRVTIETSWVNIRCDSGCTLPPLRIEANNVTVSGVTITGMDKTVIAGNGNTIHRCTFTASAGVRVRGNENTIQYNYFGQKPASTIDIGGVQIDAGPGEESRNNLIYGNYFDQLTDGASTGWDFGSSNGHTPATVVAWNLSVADTNYTTNEWQWIVNCSENGFDMKGGAATDNIADLSLFFGNISIGHTPTNQECGGSGSYGDGLLFHRRARNWDVFGNISIQDATGFRVASYQNDESKKDRVENINIHHNLILYPRHGFQRPDRPNPVDGLAAQVLCRNCAFTDNVIVGAAATNPINASPDVRLNNNRVLTGIPDTVKIMTAWGEIVAPAAEDRL